MSDAFPQLRQDLVTGAWTLIAPGRADRPEPLVLTKQRTPSAIETCPFENLAAIVPAPVQVIGEGGAWRLIIIPNKFPALTENKTCPVTVTEGLYTYMSGVGVHSLLLTRDHQRPFSDLEVPTATEVLSALQQYSKTVAADPCCQYVSVFQNWGETAGASQTHPHFQMLALPVVPPEVKHSLVGSTAYYKKTGRCAHCDIVADELARKERLIYENEGAVVISPYAASRAYELCVYPKTHTAQFDAAPKEQLAFVTEALLTALTRLRDRLNDPDYNLFIHTSPAKNTDEHTDYHWHIEILPKTNILAGFDLGTGIVINPVTPEDAARLLK